MMLRLCDRWADYDGCEQHLASHQSRRYWLPHSTQDLYGTITIPRGVFNEMVRIGKIVPGTLEVQTLSWITVCDVQDLERVRALRSILDLGEAEAIALALELSAELVLLDERPGRQLAQQLGLSVTGVLGVLLEAKAKQLIDEIKPLMEQLVSDMNFRIGQPLYQGVLGDLWKRISHS